MRSLPLYVVFLVTIGFVVLFPDIVLWLPKQLLPESVGCFKSPTGVGYICPLRPSAAVPCAVTIARAVRRAPADAAPRRRDRRPRPRAASRPSAFRALYDAFLRHQVLVFPAAELPPAAQVAFARQFGEVQVHVMSMYHADGFPELYRLSNLGADGKPNGKHPDKGTLAWHTDGSWRQVTGQATIIYGEIVPEVGGETHFCDMYGAYERLSDPWKRRIAGLRAVHNLDFSRTRRHGVDLMSEAQNARRRRSSSRWCAAIPRPAAPASISATMPSRSSACRTTRDGRSSTS